MGINYTPHTWTSGETVTATEMNTEIRDLSNGIQAAWTSYTPGWVGSVGNGTLTGAYMQLGKTIFLHVELLAGTTTTFGSGTIWTFTVPVASVAGPISVGTCHAVQGSNHDGGLVFIESDGKMHSVISNAQVINTVPWSWGSGDRFNIMAVYEAA